MTNHKTDRRNRAFELLKVQLANTPSFNPEDADIAREHISHDVTLAYAYVDELDRQGGLTE